MRTVNLEFLFGCIITLFALAMPAIMFNTIAEINEKETNAKVIYFANEQAESLENNEE
ncbi:MAG: hypothetical protein ACXITV_08625 [Luteibaculaceae bacterium]